MKPLPGAFLVFFFKYSNLNSFSSLEVTLAFFSWNFFHACVASPLIWKFSFSTCATAASFVSALTSKLLKLKISLIFKNILTLILIIKSSAMFFLYLCNANIIYIFCLQKENYKKINFFKMEEIFPLILLFLLAYLLVARQMLENQYIRMKNPQ